MQTTQKRQEAETWAQALLDQMTIEEKAGQLAAFFPNGNKRLGIPHMQHGECLHGMVADRATSFPQALALGCMWDPELVEEVASIVAKEARALGVHHCFAPMLGVVRDPRWGRIQEAYGEDTYLVTRTGVAFCKGLQGMGEERLNRDHIIATLKHLVADGEPEAGLNGAAMELSERKLREIDLPPFEACIKEAQAASIMPAHHALNGIPCHANSHLIEDICRQEFGFEGMIVSDNGDIRKLYTTMKVCSSLEESAKLAMDAGVDTELAWLIPWNENRIYGPALIQAVKDGLVSMEQLDTAVRRVLLFKYEMDLLHDPCAKPEQESLEACYQNVEGDAHVSLAGKTVYYGTKRDDVEEVLQNPQHDAIALKAAQKAIVLLKNQNALLPLNVSALQTIAVLGPNSDRVLLGNYATAKPRHYVSVLEGIRRYVGRSVQVLTSQGCDPDTYLAVDIPEAVACARKADVAILVVGGNEITCMENQDVDDLNLKGDQQQLIEAVYETGTPVVMVLLDGRPSSIEWADQHIPAILEGFYLGQECGTALANVLFGEYNPGGKLSVTVPRNVGQIPCYYNKLIPGRAPDYYQSPVKPLYPFGYGLSYTRFSIHDLRVVSCDPTVEEDVQLAVEITNIGARAGEEVVQLYVRDEISSLVRPEKELKGFRRVFLEAGETRTLSFTLKNRDLAFWMDGRWVVEPGEFTVTAGNSSADEQARCTFAVRG